MADKVNLDRRLEPFVIRPSATEASDRAVEEVFGVPLSRGDRFSSSDAAFTGGAFLLEHGVAYGLRKYQGRALNLQGKVAKGKFAAINLAFLVGPAALTYLNSDQKGTEVSLEHYPSNDHRRLDVALRVSDSGKGLNLFPEMSISAQSYVINDAGNFALGEAKEKKSSKYKVDPQVKELARRDPLLLDQIMAANRSVTDTVDSASAGQGETSNSKVLNRLEGLAKTALLNDDHKQVTNIKDFINKFIEVNQELRSPTSRSNIAQAKAVLGIIDEYQNAIQNLDSSDNTIDTEEVKKNQTPPVGAAEPVNNSNSQQAPSLYDQFKNFQSDTLDTGGKIAFTKILRALKILDQADTKVDVPSDLNNISEALVRSIQGVDVQGARALSQEQIKSIINKVLGSSNQESRPE